MDGFLRRVARESPNSLTRMYADDTAMVLKNWPQELTVLASIFADLQAAAHLALNISKCFFIPLHQEQEDTIRTQLDTCCSGFGSFKVQSHGKYLGFVVGPGKQDRAWEEALDKAEKRVAAWSWAPLGLFFATSVWNTFIVPVLGLCSFLAAE